MDLCRGVEISLECDGLDVMVLEEAGLGAVHLRTAWMDWEKSGMCVNFVCVQLCCCT